MMRILFLNPQGNFDKYDSYWTMHPDFGGQLVYVKEIATAMAQLGHQVDIVTRRVDDPNYPEFRDQLDEYPEVSGLRIIRIQCGPNAFLNKELLWEYLNEWTDNIISFYKQENTHIDFLTGHYGDGGLACAILKAKINVPFSFTGHSLGAQKLDKLHMTPETFEMLDTKYQFTKRILAECIAIKYSDIIFVSTSQEQTEQYTHDLYIETTKHITPSKFVIVPPGANTKMFAPYSGENVSPVMTFKIETIIQRDISESIRLMPFIIAASRLDPKKNHIGLVNCYAKNPELQSRANLMISVRGIENVFDGIESLPISEKQILSEILSVIESNQLSGKVTFISINSQSELADTYRYMTKRKSVFALTALYEPFGLAPIEAMSTGLPAIVTKNGGPSEVLHEGNEDFGVLVDSQNETDISKGILKVLNHYEHYKQLGMKRVATKYTWNITAQLYLNAIVHVLKTDCTKEVQIHPYFLHPTLKKIQDYDLKKRYFRHDRGGL